MKSPSMKLIRPTSSARDHIAFIAKKLGGTYALGASQSAAATPRTPYEALKAYLFGPTAKSFIDLREPGASVPPGHVHASAPGYRGLYGDEQEIWLPYACFERIAGGPAKSRDLKAELHARETHQVRAAGQRALFLDQARHPGAGPSARHCVASAPIPIPLTLMRLG